MFKVLFSITVGTISKNSKWCLTLGLFTKIYCAFSYVFFTINVTNPRHLIILLIVDDQQIL